MCDIQQGQKPGERAATKKIQPSGHKSIPNLESNRMRYTINKLLIDRSLAALADIVSEYL